MNEISKYANDWFLRGEDDMGTMEILLKEHGVPNAICFHAQQMAEKYLKGFLAYHKKNVRKVHSIENLLKACIVVDGSFGKLSGDAIFLDQFYTETRYADDYIEFSREDAEKAFEAATRIKEFILEKVKTN